MAQSIASWLVYAIWDMIQTIYLLFEYLFKFSQT